MKFFKALYRKFFAFDYQAHQQAQYDALPGFTGTPERETLGIRIELAKIQVDRARAAVGVAPYAYKYM